MTAVGKLLSSGQLAPGSASARLMGNIIVNARFALDRWHIQPDNTSYEQAAKTAINDLASQIRRNGGTINGSMG